jgi:soluble lytic murein transglycosylase
VILMRQVTQTIAICVGFALAQFAAQPLRAQEPSATSAVESAFAALARRDWQAAEAHVASAGPVARDLVTWSRLRAGEGDFGEHLAFLQARPGWPGMDRIRSRAEEAIPKGHPADEVLAFFADEPPLTGSGVLRLAEALSAKDRRDEAEAILVEAWTTLSLTDSAFDALNGTFSTVLAPHHASRAHMLLWRWRSTEAARLVPLLSGDDRALVQARLAVIRKDGDMDARVAAVPQALLADPGLNYDRFNLRADRGDYSDAVAILSERSVSAAALGEPFRWASWRSVLARWEMRQGRAAEAYDLASRHFLTEGASFADLEWLAGYVALTYLEDAPRALAHFERVEAAVDGAISAGRAGYWIGRAHEAMGDTDAADAAYARAAQHQTGFYGLLAAERAGLPLDPALTGREAFASWKEAAFLRTDVAQAALLLIGAEERGTAVQFLVALGKELDRTGIAQLGALLTEMDEPFFTVLLGKVAATRGIILPATYFPLHNMAKMELPVAPELALSIARRESEFNPVVGSPAGALGLMQLMPGTAEEVARELGLPYSRARLTADWEYNTILGARYLANLQDRFGDSPVMIAAGYNAGPGRPRTWMSERGDPRTDAVDVIDWIEHIPFKETREYVMRVTETIPIYRARLTGETGDLRFTDMLRGKRPFVRPMGRPETRTATISTSDIKPAEDGPQTLATQVVQTVPQPAPPAQLQQAMQQDQQQALPQSLRPVARPGS